MSSRGGVFPKVCLVAPFAPPYGGMAVQAEQWVGQFGKHGLPILPVRVNRRPTDVSLWYRVPVMRTATNLVRFLMEFSRTMDRSDVVAIFTGFFNYFFWVTYPALILARAKRKPAILNVRGGGAGRFFERYGPIVKPAMNGVSAVIAPSGFLAQAVEQAFGIKAQIVPTMVDVARFSFKIRELRIPKLLAARNLEAIYGLDVVLESFARIREKEPCATLSIVGDGSLRSNLAELSARLGLSSSVHFYGPVRHEDMPGIYERHDVLVNASRVDNLPNVILEAFACGLPVVSTRAGGIPYLVDHERTGILVDVDDPIAMAEAVLQVVAQPGRTRTMVLEARAEAERHAPDKVVSQFLEVVESVLSSPGSEHIKSERQALDAQEVEHS